MYRGGLFTQVYRPLSFPLFKFSRNFLCNVNFLFAISVYYYVLPHLVFCVTPMTSKGKRLSDVNRSFETLRYSTL